jgi:hypothetical protein
MRRLPTAAPHRQRGDIAARRRQMTAPRPSLPTALPAPPRTPAGKARVFDVGGGYPARHGLSAGGSRIRTPGPTPSRTCAEPYRPALTPRKPEDETRKPGRALSILRTEVRILQPLPTRCRRFRAHPVLAVSGMDCGFCGSSRSRIAFKAWVRGDSGCGSTSRRSRVRYR